MIEKPTEEDLFKNEELRREKSFSTNLLETLQVIVLVLDPQGRIVYFNPYFEHLTGTTLEQTKGKDWFTTFLPERDRAGIRDLFDGAIRGLLVSGKVNPILTAEGREREIEWSARLLYGADDQLLGLLCSGIDITERKKAERWLQGLIDTTQDAVISIDRQGRVVLFNPAAERIFGYKREEVAGQKVNMLMASPYASEHDEYIARYERTREPRAIGRIRTVTARRKSGELFPIELSVTEIATDAEVHYAAFVRDISDKVKLQEQAIESGRLAAIGTMAAKFGHELGNPLNGMSLTIQLLEQRLSREAVSTDNQVTSTVSRLKSEIARLSLLLQDFRALSRKEKFEFRKTSVQSLVTEALELELPRLKGLGIQVQYDCPAGLPAIAVDADKMKQVILNLANNATDAMPGGGKLTIQASRSSDGIVLEISDTGVGISPDVDVFEPFFTTKPHGTGIGLTIVRQILQTHGGTIRYQSEPGKGTSFFITLPTG